MNPLMLDGVFKLASGLLDRFFPDPVKKAEAALELAKMQETGELARLTMDTDLMKGQLEINRVESTHSSVFVAGWRPFVGWICGGSLAFAFVGRPLLVSFGLDVPQLETSELFTMLGGLLGFGAYRTFEKVKGVAS